MYNLTIMERFIASTIGFGLAYFIFFIIQYYNPTFEFSWVGIAVGAYGINIIFWIIDVIRKKS